MKKSLQLVVVSIYIMSSMPFFVPEILANIDSGVNTETTTSTEATTVNGSAIITTTTVTTTTAKGIMNTAVSRGTTPEIPEFGPGANATTATLVIPESNATLVIPEFGPGANATTTTLVIPESNATLVIPESG